MNDAEKHQFQPCCSEDGTCSCAGLALEGEKPALWIIGRVDTPIGIIPQVATDLTFRDRVGSWKARWDMGRMDYKVSPGLYAVGHPESTSPVLVSANYKLSFDRLRQELKGLNLWILVLDTKGINVWCAAGKGTFGTDELVRRIAWARLSEVVTHRRLILPQLGAPGVSAHVVREQTGFKVIYGPVRAQDIQGFLQAGMKATPEMREVKFGVVDRLILTPVELAGIAKPALYIMGLLFVFNLILNGTVSFYSLLGKAFIDFLPFMGAGLTGAVLVPVLLPYIPGRALSWKGWLMGLVWTGVYLRFLTAPGSLLHVSAYLLLIPPVVSFLAMNFTGATTYTSLSGVVKEMKVAIPAQIVSAGLGVILLVVKMFGMG